jgi:hypothetical protein
MQVLIKAKELGITHDDVEKYKQKQEAVPDVEAKELLIPISPFDDLSEDEIKYWATPYFDEIQARKEAQKQKIAREGELRGN